MDQPSDDVSILIFGTNANSRHLIQKGLKSGAHKRCKVVLQLIHQLAKYSCNRNLGQYSDVASASFALETWAVNIPNVITSQTTNQIHPSELLWKTKFVNLTRPSPSYLPILGTGGLRDAMLYQVKILFSIHTLSRDDNQIHDRNLLSTGVHITLYLPQARSNSHTYEGYMYV